MQFKLEVVNGVAKITDAATGAALPWVDTVDFVIAPGGTPILYLGTFAFSADISAGRPAPAPGPAVAAVGDAPTPAP